MFIATSTTGTGFQTRSILFLLLECPELGDLILVNVLNDPLEWSLNPRRSAVEPEVELPRLQKLCLLDHTYEIAYLLSRSILPEFTRLSLACSLEGLRPEADPVAFILFPSRTITLHAYPKFLPLSWIVTQPVGQRTSKED